MPENDDQHGGSKPVQVRTIAQLMKQGGSTAYHLSDQERADGRMVRLEDLLDVLKETRESGVPRKGKIASLAGDVLIGDIRSLPLKDFQRFDFRKADISGALLTEEQKACIATSKRNTHTARGTNTRHGR